MMLCGAARVAHPQRSVLIGAAKGSASATCYMKVSFLDCRYVLLLPRLGLLNNKNNYPDDDKVSSS